jgi:hypothetical protein
VSGKEPSGNPTTSAPLRPASRITSQAFSTVASRSRKTGATCAAASRMVGNCSFAIRLLPILVGFLSRPGSSYRSTNGSPIGSSDVSTQTLFVCVNSSKPSRPSSRP